MNVQEQLETMARPDTLPQALLAEARPSGFSLALNYLPLLNLLAGAALLLFVDSVAAGIATLLAWIYLLPPLACRITIGLFGMPQGDGLDQSARAYKVWWFLAQLQVLFNRFGMFEELLRMVPGLYALWLNAWGARVSAMVYWGPGAMVVDRQAVRIDRNVVIGTRAVLAGHIAVRDSGGAFRVTLAPVEIGAGALIGAYAGIGPGCKVAPEQEVPTAAFLRPFTQWKDGQRIKSARPRST
jgi:UDP-3-O-[3-hydroxymyristoyl] glucosamine N-acyltransferase